MILESAALTAAVVFSLTLFTFFAAKRGYDFNFLGPFLFAAMMVMMFYCLIQVFTSPVSFPGSFEITNIVCSHPSLSLTPAFPTTGKDREYYLQLHRCHCVLSFHRLRHWQPHQALHLRWVHYGIHLFVSRHHQPLLCLVESQQLISDNSCTSYNIKLNRGCFL